MVPREIDCLEMYGPTREKNLSKEKENSICIEYERICSFVERGELWEKGIDNDERMIYICF